MRSSGVLLGLSLLLAASLAARPAVAQDASVRERAEASFRAGAAAYAAGEYQAAIQALEAAYQLTPLPAIGFSLAQAERRQYFATHELSHLERAIALYRSYVTLMTQGGRRADALDALAQLEPLAAALGAKSEPPSARSETSATRLLVTCDAPGARIVLDDSSPVPSPLVREVTPGRHRAAAEAAGFFPAQRELVALEGELILGEMSLRERPSTLRLDAPSTADVYIDGNFAAQGAAELKLELPAGRHRLAVAAKGARVAYRSLELERGETLALRLTPHLTSQRIAARALFVAGGAVLAAGIVFGGVAIHEEGQAQNFLDQRERGNVTQAQLDDYHDNVSDRDLYRTLGVASVGTAAVLLVSGLLLYELNRPSPRDIQRDARSLPAGPRDAGTPSGPVSLARGTARFDLSAVTAAPWLSKGALGVALRQRF